MSATKPPNPGGGRDWPVDPASRNGSPAETMSESDRRLVVLGYITAVAMPPIGLILGIVVATRQAPASRHGRWILLVSLIAAVIWALVFTSGALSPSNTDTSY